MSVASPTSSDYSTVIEDCRAHLNNGTHPTGEDLRLVIAVCKDAISRMESTGAVSDIAAETAAVRALWDTHIAILQAGGAGDISAEVDAADAAIEAAIVLLEAAVASAEALTEAQQTAADIVDEVADAVTAVEALRADWDTQIALLQAGGAGDIEAAVDTADTAVEAVVADMETASAALDAVEAVAAPTYNTDFVDG